MKQTKTEAKPSKVKKSVNPKQIVKKYLARPIAFITLFVFASYGIRHALESLQDPMQVGLTILLTVGLAYILFND